MNIRELKNFIRIVEVGSLSRAALSLNIAQQALGLQVRNLEAEFKRTLLVRHSRGVQPTDAGRLLAAHARQILHEIDKTYAAIAELDTQAGHVALGMTTSINDTFLAKLFRLCRERHPHIRVDITESNSSRLARMAQSGELDLACLFGDGHIRGLGQELLLKDEWMLVSSGVKPTSADVSFSELESLPLVLPSRTSGMRQRLEQEARSRGFELKVVLEVQSGTLMRQLLENGVGHSVLPFLSVRHSVEAGVLNAARIVDPSFISRTYVVYREGQVLPPPAAAVKALLVEIAQGLSSF
jgi:LysR family nitrogen assimilation transcriptional regulator